ncbi:MAG: hypothetical protein ACR2J5_07755, partial [Geodermatophilaceae bacterium]
GAQNARTFSASAFAAATGNLLWPSTPVAAGPHAQLLAAADRHGQSGLSEEQILDSAYGLMALDCIWLQGRYFTATDPAGVIALARSFIASHRSSRHPAGVNVPAEPILVAPVRGSDCYQVLDGHHRAALAHAAGSQTVRVRAKWLPVTTPLQDLLTQMSWLDGDRQLYQPLSAPELHKSWPTVRRCTDRLEKMSGLLAARDLLPPMTSSYLDVASCYGWFVAQMGELGYRAEGMERDPLGATLGQAAYCVEPEWILIGDCVELLGSAGRQWDVVSCFSLLHHFALGRASVGPEELLRLLDSVTGRVLFLDTGQEHEAWFAESLLGWDADYIAKVLRENTTFDEIIDLGPDLDAVPPHQDNYGRNLFACLRTQR